MAASASAGRAATWTRAQSAGQTATVTSQAATLRGVSVSKIVMTFWLRTREFAKFASQSIGEEFPPIIEDIAKMTALHVQPNTSQFVQSSKLLTKTSALPTATMLG